MQIEIERASLLPALIVVSGVVDRRQTLPILGNLLVDSVDGKVTMSATDLELQVVTSVEALKTDDGRVTLPARKMVDICRALPEEVRVQLTVTGERATLVAGRSRFVLSTMPPEDFPTLTEDAEGTSFKVDQSALRRLLEKAAISMAVQDVRYYLNGVLLRIDGDHLLAVATDGHRLSKIDGAKVRDVQGGPRQVILPGKTVTELKRLLEPTGKEVLVRCSERTLTAVLDGTELTTKLVDGRYPEFERVIPKDLSRRALIDRSTLLGALHRTAILSNEKFKGVRMTFTEGLLKLESENPDREAAEEELEVDYSGDDVMIGFNVSYVLDVLGAVDAERIEVAFSGPKGSAIWKGEDREDETFVVMPMQLYGPRWSRRSFLNVCVDGDCVGLKGSNWNPGPDVIGLLVTTALARQPS
jgi:DNA polymerase III subunit beta